MAGKNKRQHKRRFTKAWRGDDNFMRALQDELALRLEKQKAAADTLAIDRV